MLTAKDVAALLERSRKIGEGRYVGKCPVHGGGDNFYMTDGDIGTLIYCHAGCSKDRILDALKLEWSDLFKGDGKRRPYDPYPDILIMALYRADLKAKREISNKDGRIVSAASDRLYRKGYRQQPDGSYAN